MEIKNYIYQLRTKLTKAQSGNKIKARCQVEIKQREKINKYIERNERKEKSIDMLIK